MTPPSSSPPSCRTAVAHARTGLRHEGPAARQIRRHEEVLSAGEVYYLAPGHIPIAEEPLETVEFSPSADYEKRIAALTA
jgi:hypothetical protein